MQRRIPEGYEEFEDSLRLMLELAHILRKEKVNRGYIDFATGNVAWDESYNGATPVVHTNLKEIFGFLKPFIINTLSFT